MLRFSASASPWPQPVGPSNGRRPQAWSDWPFTSPRAHLAAFLGVGCPEDFAGTFTAAGPRGVWQGEAQADEGSRDRDRRAEVGYSLRSWWTAPVSSPAGRMPSQGCSV